MGNPLLSNGLIMRVKPILHPSKRGLAITELSSQQNPHFTETIHTHDLSNWV